MKASEIQQEGFRYSQYLFSYGWLATRFCSGLCVCSSISRRIPWGCSLNNCCLLGFYHVVRCYINDWTLYPSETDLIVGAVVSQPPNSPNCCLPIMRLMRPMRFIFTTRYLILTLLLIRVWIFLPPKYWQLNCYLNFWKQVIPVTIYSKFILLWMKNVKLKSMTHLRSHGKIMEKQMKPKPFDFLIGKSCPIP